MDGGAGIEQAFAHHLIGRVEYLYADYGHKDFTVAPGDIYNVGFKTHTIRAALVSKFDGDRGTSPGAMAMAGPVSNWNGFYIGGDIGGAFQHLDGTSNFFENDGTGGPIENNFRRQSGNGNTVAGGFHAGYNWQIAPSWLVGFEGDYQWMRPNYAGCRGTTVPGTDCSNVGFVGFATIGGETRSIATVRGRVGATFDRLLVYGTGGVAFADVQTQLGMNCVSGCGIPSVPFANTVNFASVKTGWVAGAGVEWMLDANWIVRAEYLHAGFGQLADTLNLPLAACNLSSPCGLSWSRELHYDIVRAGISYKFGG